MTPHALTVDLEDWHQLLHRRVTAATTPPSKHVVTDTYRILELLDDAAVRATFFVVGAVADAYPELVREVAARGHEIGSHTYRHELVDRLRPDEFRADIARSRQQLQDLTGQPVLGFRAPEFSVGDLGHWSFSVLAEVGFAYDSSVFPVAGARYGIPAAPPAPFPIETACGTIWEFPLATWAVGRRQLPVAGGSYFRVLPQPVLRRALRQREVAGHNAVLYVHPYEFHRGWLYLSGLSWRQRLHPAHVRFGLLHNVATSAVTRRVRSLLAEFKFVPLEALYRHYTGELDAAAGEMLGSPQTTDTLSL
jgi:polysaccharide deacetylase family protein (PEP-CTERM system associated)